MRKKILIVILIIILVKVVVLAVITVTNKTFYKKYFETLNSTGEKTKVPLPFFSYYIEETSDHVVTFNTLRSAKEIEKILNNYVENLPSCYAEGYFYDADADITISRYYIEDKFPFNKIYLNYDKGNHCENEFVLGNNWMSDVMNNAEFQDINIDRCVKENDNMKCDTKELTKTDIEGLFNYAYPNNSTRIENKTNIDINEGEDYFSVSAFYKFGGNGYTLMAFSYNDNLAFMVTDADDHTMNAIYDIDKDVNELFNTIYNSK